MTTQSINLTAQQNTIVTRDGHAFISACPGSGKTRLMIERAKVMLKGMPHGRGIAFLSFTRAAVSELEDRLRQERIVGTPAFPHFIGTFDSFIWHFLIAPFGIKNVVYPARLIPDQDSKMILPFRDAHPLTLGCFDRTTGHIIPREAQRRGFNVSEKSASQIGAYVTSANSLRAAARARGFLDYDDARLLAKERLVDEAQCQVLRAAISARFYEVIVDEAQDCSPDDLSIIGWLRAAKIPTKVICDPHQSIYGFRGGVTDDLIEFEKTFEQNQKLGMSGNFRSSPNICKAISTLRPPDAQEPVDEALGVNKEETTRVYVLSYGGRGVPSAIGLKFAELVASLNLDLSQCPVLAATKNSGASAVGNPAKDGVNDLTYRLASAVAEFYFAFETGKTKDALIEAHKVFLEIEGKLGDSTYHQYITTNEISGLSWRPRVVQMLRELHYDPSVFADTDAWHQKAKGLFSDAIESGGRTISQILRRNQDIESVLLAASPCQAPSKTIHSVKGKQFPGVCIVTTSQTIGRILDYVESGANPESAEDARKIYVGASRAERLLAIAVPKSQADRFAAHIARKEAQVEIIKL